MLAAYTMKCGWPQGWPFTDFWVRQKKLCSFFCWQSPPGIRSKSGLTTVFTTDKHGTRGNSGRKKLGEQVSWSGNGMKARKAHEMTTPTSVGVVEAASSSLVTQTKNGDRTISVFLCFPPFFSRFLTFLKQIRSEFRGGSFLCFSAPNTQNSGWCIFWYICCRFYRTPMGEATGLKLSRMNRFLSLQIKIVSHQKEGNKMANIGVQGVQTR